MVVKERFRDWGLYHKAVVVILVASFLWIAGWAAIVWGGAFAIERRKTIPFAVTSIWPWVVTDDNRPRWIGELVNIGRMSGVEGTSGAVQLLFLRRGTKQWQAVEHVTNVLPGRVFEAKQTSDIALRWTKVELVPIAPCMTQVIFKETIRPIEYAKRFWFFLVQQEREERLDISLDALEQWMKETTSRCIDPDE